jgi:acyl-CoA thioesterase
MSTSGLITYPALVLEPLGDARFSAQHADRQEDRDVVFSGQIIAQMIMAADATVESRMDVKSIQVLFARPATHTVPIEYQVDTLHAGRNWSSHTITAWQGGKPLSRGQVLMSVDEPDLMSHQPVSPAVGAPEAGDVQPALAFPGAEIRSAVGVEAVLEPVPTMAFWIRAQGLGDSVAAQQAALAWATPGEIIGLAMKPHPDSARIEDTHQTLSTGVIGHTIHFHNRFSFGDWLLVSQEATWAGRGRIFGRGEVFRADGVLAATFSQDAMAKVAAFNLDPSRSM